MVMSSRKSSEMDNAEEDLDEVDIVKEGQEMEYLGYGDEHWDVPAQDYLLVIPLRLHLGPVQAEEFAQEIKTDLIEIHTGPGESVGDVEIVTREVAAKMFDLAVKEVTSAEPEAANTGNADQGQ